MKYALAIAMMLMTAVPALAWNEPDSFRGVPWGATREETEKVYRDREETTPTCRQSYCWTERLIGPVSTKIIYGFTDGKMTSVVVTFNPKDHATLRSIFVERYGRPSEEKNEPYQTKGGLKTTNSVTTWSGNKVFIHMRAYGQRIDEGDVAISLREELDREIRDRRKEIQKGKGDL